MKLSFLILVCGLLSACATTPKFSDVKAPAVGYVRSLKFNGQTLAPGKCKVWMQGQWVPVSEGRPFRADLPIGKGEIGTLRCDIGLLLRTIDLKVKQEIEISPDSLNLLADFKWNLTTDPSSKFWLFMFGGRVFGNFQSTQLRPETQSLILEENPDLKKLKKNEAAVFE